MPRTFHWLKRQKHTWIFLWLWFAGGAVLIWLKSDSKDPLLGIFGTFSVLVVPVMAAYQTAHHYGMSSVELNARAEWIMERWGWKALWFGGGMLSLLIATSSAVFGAPEIASRALLTSLFVFGATSAASIATLAQERMGDRLIRRRDPADSLYPGQFLFALVGMGAIGLMASAMLLVACVNALGLADAIDATGHSSRAEAVRWGAGIVAGLWAVAVVVVEPSTAMFQWFAARRNLDKMKTDALLKLAAAVSTEEKAQHD